MLRFGKAIELARKATIPLIAWGRQGIGKTSVVNQKADELFGGNSDRKDPTCITLILSQMEPTDLIGLPGKVQQADGAWKTEYMKPAWWPEDEGGILFLDELNRATRDCINAAHQLVLEGRIFNNKLPKGWIVVAACNPDTDDEFGLVRFGAAFNDRFCHVEVNASWPAWKKWAEENGVADDVLSFLSANTEALNGDSEQKWDFSKDILCKVAPSSRSWDAVSRIRKAVGDDTALLNGVARTMIKGLVGNELCAMYFKHLEEYLKKVMTLADILAKGIKDKRWQAALKAKDLPYINEVLERAGKEFEDALTKVQKSGKEGAVEKALSKGGKYDKWWELLETVPDDVLIGWWSGLQSNTVWDEVALTLPPSFGRKVTELYNAHNDIS